MLRFRDFPRGKILAIILIPIKKLKITSLAEKTRQCTVSKVELTLHNGKGSGALTSIGPKLT